MKRFVQFSLNYNKIVRCLLVTFCIGIIIFAVSSVASAATVLDEIQNYEIKVDMRPNGTMDIYYNLESFG